jgi:ABC-type lipoprotein release transport system permease subunit
MQAYLDELGVIVRIAFRNLFASRWKTIIIGGIVLFGSYLVVLGSSLLDSIDSGMRRSIQGSLGGHVQVYRADSKDDLAIYGGMMGPSDLRPIDDFGALKAVLRDTPNVREVVPMGIDQAMVSTGNVFDRALERLRASVKARLDGDRSPEAERTYAAKKAHVEHMTGLLRTELSEARAIIDVQSMSPSEQADFRRNAADLVRATTPGFWREDFEEDPLGALEFLENRIAPLSLDGGAMFINYVGTDHEAFRKAFDRMELVKGQWVPPGKRGALIGTYYAEEYLKLKTAHRLDKIRDALARGEKIAEDEELQRWVRENTTMTRDILLQLDPRQSDALAAELRSYLRADETELQPLLSRFLETDDRNFAERYAWFYDRIVPHLHLYMFSVGDTITIKAPTRTGYINSVNVKIYGIVNFRGMEKSGLASVMTILDLMTWRDLYGHITKEKAAEIAELKKTVGAEEISREDAEAALFGSADAVSQAETQTTRIEDPVLGERVASEELFGRTYAQAEIDGGVALNAAVILEEASRRDIRRAVKDVEAALKDFGVPMKVVDWQQAAGMVGQTVTLFRVVLYVVVGIIFAVALIIINNAMVMATLQRVKEIGTIRAIGAQKRFVLGMLVLETIVIGLAFGLAGAVLGAATVKIVTLAGGIPAPNDQLFFLFSGPALLPSIGATSMAIALAIVFCVSVLSGLYPALLAMRVTPVEAMSTEE